MRRALSCLVGIVLAVTLVAAPAVATESDDLWYGVDEDGEPTITLYFVFSTTCPHCQAAMRFVESLEETRPWLEVWWVAADQEADQAVIATVLEAAEATGQQIQVVPTFMYCEKMATGYDNAEGSGAELASGLHVCHDSRVLAVMPATTEAPAAVDVPGVGTVEAASVSLPVFTVVVAALDAFNPCAFFVLLFLLSLLVHTRSRRRMAAIGGLFVLISGALYFVFMAAWLNLFLVVGHLRWITVAAGALAIVLGVLNAKDALLSGAGPSTSIPESAKPSLFGRMRSLITVDRALPVFGATIALAVAANSYELLCTAGLPMVFTRVLTLSDLATPAYYGYLALYNLVYVLPLLAIVAGFVWLLGARKLQPSEGRTLKLLSGTMMIGLGGVLLLAPDSLQRMGIALAVIGGALVITLFITAIDRASRSDRPRRHRPSATP